MDRARISMVIRLSVASAILLALASSCAVVDATGATTRNGRFWIAAGHMTDRTGSTDAYNSPDARLVEPGE